MESFALLWNVSKDKLYELGKKCGLLPGANVGSSELHCVVTLSSGITDEVEEGDIHPSPADKLKEALSSGTAFTKLYLVIFYTLHLLIQFYFKCYIFIGVE